MRHLTPTLYLIVNRLMGVENWVQFVFESQDAVPAGLAEDLAAVVVPRSFRLHRPPERDYTYPRPSFESDNEGDRIKEFVKALREYYSWSQPKLASYLNVTTETVKRLESGGQKSCSPVVRQKMERLIDGIEPLERLFARVPFEEARRGRFKDH